MITDLHDDPPEGLPPAFAEWWRDHLPRIRQAYSPERNGHIPSWVHTLASIPSPPVDATPDLNRDAIWDGTTDAQDRETWMNLHPWRKGPFQLGELHLETEWRSDWKWNRLQDVIHPLDGRSCLDVGCGNGYHLWRMKGAGARHAIGIDPYLLYVFQFHAVHRRIPNPDVQVLPLGAEHLDRKLDVDTVFSMGVLYHAADPHLHLRTLRNVVRAGGELVLETLIVPDEFGPALSINGRYAKMRNIRLLPTTDTLRQWVEESGWREVTIADVSVTSFEEQRSTDWMTFHSLAQFLDPADPTKTIEGFPAPRRCLLVAQAPG